LNRFKNGGITVDPVQLESAILNLCINARDAMPHGGYLTIDVINANLDFEYAKCNPDVLPGAYVMLAVSDTGTGMSREVLERAFEPFFTTKEQGTGSGLGLSMVYGFAKQSKGHVKIYSEQGRGTVIKLYLPRSTIPLVKQDTDVPMQGGIGGSECILLVEDDDMVRSHGTGLLKSLGYRVITAHNAVEAWEMLQQGMACDLLFTDVVMPGGMTGPELAEAAQRLHPDLRVLFTSGYTNNAILHQEKINSAIHLLHKPYRRETLASKVRAALGK
jgi:CheY-like chemotaxis protein